MASCRETRKGIEMAFRYHLLLTLALLAPMASLAQAPTTSPKESIVLTDKEAFGLMPPELVAPMGVKQAMWSPDGQYILLLREDTRITPEKLREMIGKQGQPPAGNTVISIWDKRERRLTDIWKRPMGSSYVQYIQWLPGSSSAIAKLSVTDPPKKEGEPGEYHSGIIRISAATGSVKTITDSTISTSFVQEFISPMEPILLFRDFAYTLETTKGADGKETKRMNVTKDNIVTWRDLSGFSPPTALPSDLKMADVTWAQDGTPVIECMVRGGKPSTKPETRKLALNVKTGKFTVVNENTQMFKPSVDARSIHIKQVRTPVREANTKRQVPFVWLESNSDSIQPRVMVAANSELGILSPKSDAVLYVTNGAAWITPLFRMSKEEFLAALEQAERMTALSKAKQLGLGLLMYSQDYDEVLPGSEGVNEKITPYIKNDSLFEGFVYTYGGGPLKDIEFPSETELGYVNGPGGRAIIYADGHAKWRKD
jgi:hypothetical protein